MPDPNNSEGREIVAPPLARAGDAISAEKWNRIRNAVFNPLRGVNGGKQFGNVAPIAKFAMLVIGNDNGNYIKCVFWDAGTQTVDDEIIAVSKPYLLQQATLDGVTDDNGIKYTFTGIDALTSLDTGSYVSEDWTINFPYIIGEIITAESNIIGGIDNLYDLDYQDSNQAGRSWAKVPT